MATRNFLSSSPLGLRAGDPFQQFRREMDRLFDTMMPAALPEGWSEPKLDAYVAGEDFCVSAELPGVKREDVEVTLDGDVLSIVGEKKTSPDYQDGNAHVSERTYGRFMRRVQLPFRPDPEQVSAEMEGGVLTVRLRRRGAQQAGRRIEVRPAGETTQAGRLAGQNEAGQPGDAPAASLQDPAAQGRVPNP